MNTFRKLLNDRFGMFVHYGIYSALAGEYNGTETKSIGEWIQRHLEIPIKEYEEFGRKHFCPSPDFAKNLVTAAKNAGVKYIVLTSKHHDGFCLFKSNYTDYSTYGFFGRDICKELSDECKKQGLGLGLYYSHTLDWYEKDAGGNVRAEDGTKAQNRNYWDYPDDNIDLEKYLYEKCFPQVREILTNYGELKLIWFDYPHDITKEQSKELRDLVKSIQPDCQINSRIAHDCNDYESLGDNALPVAPVGVNLECLITLNDTWGYKKNDNNWKTPEEVCGIFCRTLGSDSTLLLNVGPKADGSLTEETIHILEKMGEWTERNSEAVYGNVTGNPFFNTFSWGNVSKKDNNLYLYVKDKECEKIVLNVGNNEVVKVSLLGFDKEINFNCENDNLIINQEKTDFMIPVYKVEFNNFEPLTDIVQQDDTLSLGVLWASKVTKGNENADAEKLFYEKSNYIEDFGKHGLCVNKDCQSIFWANPDEIMCWDAYFSQSGEYEATLVNARRIIWDEDRDACCDFKLSVADQTHDVNMKEEKNKFLLSRTAEFNTRISHDAGVFKIDKPGKYRILLSRAESGDDMRIEKIDFVKKN